ncbi:uncharacterized protein LOC132202246 [Neocloeon triangulifer]|uniref:uncharacterized protein LOC132202246 n=1 Tax=Neocloeon triangulifer TaxID=2078957 RepID=UPI00286F54FF|nr:uncharacterized protein LOC132202246 [Neocloeon triangulifer]
MKQPTLALLLLLAAAAAASKPASKRDWLADLRTDEAAAAAWHKRSDEQQQADHLIASLGTGNSQFLLRSPRGNRQYDVPQIECPPAEDGMERFACPTPDRMGRYRCIDDHVLCDGFIDCPNGEDEDRQACMFYKTTKAHLDVLADALLRWARGR